MHRAMKRVGVGLALATLTACARQEVRALAPAPQVLAQRVDRPTTHGMLVVGDKTIYLSHLPMFHAPHDFQAIFEASFQGANGDVQRRYAADRAKTGEKVYTIVPEPFVLTELQGGRKSFKADLVRGHFERGGMPIAEGITVSIKRVVHFRQFQPAAHQPPQFTGLLFGKGTDVFAAHWISKAPDYDQVVGITPGAALPEAALAQGLSFTVPNRANTQALQTGEASTVAMAGDPVPRKLTVGPAYYFETGDLAH